MKNIKVLMILLTAMLVLTCENASDPATNPLIGISVADETINTGSIFELTVEITDFPSELFAISGRLSFDENRISIDDTQTEWIGNIWSQSALGLLEVENGIVYFSVTQVAGSGNADNGGTILTIQVAPEQSGSTSLDLLPSQLTFYDSDGQELNIKNLDIEGISLTIL